MLSRRDTLWGGASALLLAACAGNGDARRALSDRASFQRRSGQKAVGIQTYTIREAMEQDTLGSLQMLKDVGFDYVETNRRDFRRISLGEFKSALVEVNLPVVATHLDLDMVMDEPEQVADICSVLGCKYAIVPWTPEEKRTTAGYTQIAARFNEVGEMLLGSDVRLAYHNHQFEFWDIDGPRSGMDILLNDTNPDTVWFELDIFWAVLANQDPAELFRAHPGRFKLCHIKDMLSAKRSEYEDSLDFETMVREMMVNVGEGDLPYETWLAMSDISGMEHWIVEHDNPPMPYRQSVATSLRTVRNYEFQM